MKNDFELQGISELIERALGKLDNDHRLNDDQASRILERLLDKYHFNDANISFDNAEEQKDLIL